MQSGLGPSTAPYTVRVAKRLFRERLRTALFLAAARAWPQRLAQRELRWTASSITITSAVTEWARAEAPRMLCIACSTDAAFPVVACVSRPSGSPSAAAARARRVTGFDYHPSLTTGSYRKAKIQGANKLDVASAAASAAQLPEGAAPRLRAFETSARAAAICAINTGLACSFAKVAAPMIRPDSISLFQCAPQIPRL